MDVLLVAAKKDMINDYTTVVTEAGLLPVVVDIDSFAVQNMFSANYESAEADTVVLINAGASVVNINILDRGMTIFTRDVTIGGNQFTEEIQKQLNVSYEEAEALKIGGGRSDPDAVVPQEVERVMAGVAEQVAGEIQRSLDFYAGTAADSQALQGLPLRRHGEDPGALQDHRGARGRAGGDRQPVQERGHRQPQASIPGFIMDVAPMAAVAVGLALRRPGDKQV